MSSDETLRDLAFRATPGPWRAFCERYGDTSGGDALTVARMPAVTILAHEGGD